MRPVVMKFGGTSVADAAAIARVATVVARARARGPVVVVVSAMAGVTDQLLALAAGAAARAGGEVTVALSALRERHVAAARQLLDGDADSVLAAIAPILGALERSLDDAGAAGEASAILQDAIAAAGEQLSTRIVAAALAFRSIPAAAVDPRDVVKTDASHTRATPDLEATRAAAAARLEPLLRDGVVPVVGGFVGAAPDGSTTTLGRGGSDYSASLIGAAIDAAEIQVWTDVDGMLAADPRIVASPQVVPRLSFAEASELAYFGAKVLHPSTILPAIARGIPVRILNSRRPASEGTLISNEPARTDKPLAALACKRGVTVIDITSTRMLMAYGFLRHVFETFERFRTPVDVVTTSEVSVSVTVDDSRAVPEIVEELRTVAEVSVEPDMAILCAVGENLRARPGAMSEVMRALARYPLRMVSQAASRRNLTVVLAENAAIEAMRRLHDEVFAAAEAR